jgi:hypothetical protein
MTTKKITKVIVYFDDGTFEEIPSTLSTPYVWPNVQPWMAPAPPAPPMFTVTTKDTTSVASSSFSSWNTAYSYDTMVADGAPITNKYAITSSGNGNVEIQG